MKLKLIRISNSKEVTLGVLINTDTGLPICLTLELPWKDNSIQISCIPTGTYKVERFSSPTFDNVFHILDVPNRSGVLIHTGNTVDDIKGCILVGNQFGELKNKPAVLNSRLALDDLKKYVKDNPFELEIV